jgi:hypothetical protein
MTSKKTCPEKISTTDGTILDCELAPDHDGPVHVDGESVWPAPNNPVSYSG